MRLLALFLSIGLISSCSAEMGQKNAQGQSKSKNENEITHETAAREADTYEKLTKGRVGAAYRIQMDLELKETGEPINFDYMVRCANIDVPGSFHPIISGQTHFMALSTGAAVAVSAPHHYCKRSLSNQPFNKPGDPMKMPVLAWYDDVNDLSRTWAYLTNDAYKSPLAKVRFVNYAVSRVTQDEYRDWALETSKNYKQIGAIPGPFGCMTGNALPSEPESCAYPETKERNGGQSLQVIDDGVLEHHLYSIPIVTDGFDMEAVKGDFAPQSDYYCPQTRISVLKSEEELKQQEGRKCVTPSGECSNRKTIPGRNHPDNLVDKIWSESSLTFHKTQYSNFGQLKNRRLVNYLDPVCLKGENECDIRNVYPIIPVTTDKGLVFRMLQKSEYLGFSIQSRAGFTHTDFGGFNPTGFRTPGGLADVGVLFVNDELVCDRAGKAFSFYDFKNNEYIRQTTQY